jgi:hypothetical protein
MELMVFGLWSWVLFVCGSYQVRTSQEGSRFTDFTWLVQLGRGQSDRFSNLTRPQPSAAPAKLRFKKL